MLLFTQLQKFNETKHFLCGDLRGGGGGGTHPKFGRYVPWQSEKWGAPEQLEWKMRGSGARSRVKMRVSGTDFVGCVWLALWPAANPRALPECFAFGLAAARPAMGGNERLKRKEILKMICSGADI